MAKFLGTSDQLLRTSPEEHIAIRRRERSPNTELLQFPATIGAHATLMRFFEYTYGGAKGAVETPLAEILLPLPKQIQDSFKINVQGDEIGVIGKGAADIASGSSGSLTDIAGSLAKKAAGGIVGAGSAAADALMGDFSALKEGAGKAADAAGFLTSIGAAKIAPDLVNAVGAGRGTAVNPFATLVFKGVDLKVHSLEWLLSPETEAESRELKKIIRTLQRMVLPKTDSPMGDPTGLTAIDKGILRYPAMVNIFLQGIDSNYYFKFKTSMISQLNIDYTPNGLAINKGGKPNAVRITMTLNEAYIHTAADNDTSDLEAEAIDERLLDDISNESLADIQAATEVHYPADTNFTGIQAGDEVSIIKTLPDGSTVSKVVSKEELNADGITDEMITAGAIPGEDSVAFEVKTNGDTI